MNKMITKKNKSKVMYEYLILATPRYKKSDYKPFVLKPFNFNIHWSKARAIQEKIFLGNKEFKASGSMVKEFYKLKIFKSKIKN